MKVSLAGAWAKLQRAREHRNALVEEELQSTRGERLIRVTHEELRGGLEWRFYVPSPPEIDVERVALLAGDCLFNLRSALDHLVYALHLKRFKGRIPPGKERRPEFPILDNPRTSATSDWREIGLLSFRVRRAVAFLQPYVRRNDNWTETRRALEELHHLNRVDKHRHLHVAYMATWSASVPWFGEPDPYGFRQRSYWVALEGKTEVFRWTFDTRPLDMQPYLRISNYVTAGLSLDEFGERIPLVVSLEAYANRVELVLERFEPLLA